MTLTPKQCLGPYELIAPLGAGGMGEVFSARDTRLHREVAIKVLSKDFATDADRLRRFEQEAKTLAALNHPNVLTIHDAGVHEGEPYLVSELLEGKTLREEMNGNALPVRKATDYALQIAQGLAAAHGKGIIHRDLKPENIFITKDGRVKILDFGLAKLQSSLQSPLANQKSPIDTAAQTVVQTTQPGMVLGTPAYMSPEQVRGQPVDHRSDNFAFGCVLYEMLSGQSAFRRNTPAETMSAILRDEPEKDPVFLKTVPPPLERVITHCLEKQPELRFQSAQDAAFALQTVSGVATTDRVVAGSPPRPALFLKTWPLALSVALALAIVGAFLFWRLQRPRQPKPFANGNKSVAVLPFVNVSADKNDEYLSDGMTEELLNALSKLNGLRVPGRSSSFAFKGKNEEDLFRKVGSQLNVAAVLEGSVRKAGSQLRITADLISVADGFRLWSETYDRDMTNIFAIQSDIAGRVAQALKIQLFGAGGQPKKPTENIQAYQLYLQGRQLWSRRIGESLTEAISYFNRAIAADPSYALAYSGLADCYVLLPEYTGLPLRETAPKIRAAARNAIALDQSLGEPHAALGVTMAELDWDWSGAEAELQRAMELNPNYATGHHWLGRIYIAQGKFKQALAEFERAQELDPLSPIINVNLAISQFELGNHDLAIQMLQKQIALDPGFAMAQGNLGEFYLRTGKAPEAIGALEKAHRSDPQGAWYWGRLGLAYARAGRTVEAQRELAALEALKRQGRNFTLDIALLQHGLGNDGAALDALEQAAEERSGDLPELFYSSIWEDLRPNPRAQAILIKMHLVK